MAIFKGNGVVWDKDKNKVLCNFNRGDYETTDQRECNLLLTLGFVADYDDEIVIIEDEEEVDEDAIRELAKNLGIKSWHVKNIEKLKAEILEIEGVQ